MKKKSQRVPDFATKRPASKVPGAAVDPAQPAPAPAAAQTTVKPHSTSQKSGRRGS